MRAKPCGTPCGPGFSPLYLETEPAILKMLKFYCVFIGGGMGALARYAVSIASAPLVWHGIALGTLIVNTAGCFMAGFICALLEYSPVAPVYKLFFITGFLGGFTTFSAFGIELFAFISAGHIKNAFVYTAITFGISIVCVGAGFWAAHIFPYFKKIP